MKHNTKILRYIAEHSPKWMARNVRERFQKVLQELHALHRMLQLECNGDITKLRQPVNLYTVVKAGCPHCDDFQCRRVNTCLYVQAYQIYGPHVVLGEYACTKVLFGNYNLNEVAMEGAYRVSLSSDIVTVECRADRDSDPKMVEESYKRCVKFCEGHIEWTKNPKWGSKRYKKERKR